MQIVVKKVIPEESPKSATFTPSPLKNKNNIIVLPKISLSPLKNKNIIVSQKVLNKPVKSVKPSNDDTLPIDFKKVAVSSKKMSETKVSWDALPSNICDLGQVH